MAANFLQRLDGKLLRAQQKVMIDFQEPGEKLMYFSWAKSII